MTAWGSDKQQRRKSKKTNSSRDTLDCIRLEWKVATLSRLQEMGVWLVDASKAACSGAEGGRRRRSPRGRVYNAVVQESWTCFVWPSVEADAPESLWIIGRG